MIEYRLGNLLDQFDLTHMAHQANLFHTFGSGIAKEIGLRFPRAAEADMLTTYADTAKLGTYSISTGHPIVLNLYCQTGIGSKDRQTSYDAMEKVFRKVEKDLRVLKTPVKLGIPYRIGCGLGNGDWRIVTSILVSIFEDSKVHLVICKIPDKVKD